MPCLPCLALPVAALSGGAAMSSTNKIIIAVSVVVTVLATLWFLYYTYGSGKCAECKIR
jgi:hypothetical protein